MRGAERLSRALLRGARPLAAALAASVLVGTACSLPGLATGTVDHRVAEPAGSAFDAAAMTRTFDTTDRGGVETVVARSTPDQGTITRVRAYLQQEAMQFRQGQYTDPAKQHGMEMPGSKDLEAGYAQVQVVYADLPAGGQVSYTAPDQTLVQALHAWFQRRQLGG